MSNSHDEIKRLLKASRSLLTTTKLNEDIHNIRTQYGLISEQENITTKFNLGKSIEDDIEDDEEEYETADSEDEDGEDKKESKDDKKQAYRISGGVLVLHGKNQTELELTTDEKIAFQETMDEFIAEVSDMVDFNKLNVYSQNVEWSGKIIDYNVEFFYSIGEDNGVYIEGDMMKCDDEFLTFLNKLKVYYEKFKSKWSKVMGGRKKTIKTEE
jgi:hypothetical protein